MSSISPIAPKEVNYKRALINWVTRKGKSTRTRIALKMTNQKNKLGGEILSI
jgi:hypothetical protein